MNKPISIEHEIGQLNIDTSAKQTLYRIQSIAHSEDSYRKRLVPHLFLVCPAGAGTTVYGRIYSRIINENHVHDIRSLRSFLELDFPHEATDQEYRLFLSSPRVAAATTNKFYGTFEISFSRYKGKELFENPYFDELMGFVEKNKDNIQFVFHVLPDFSEIRQLEMRLQRLLHLERVEFGYPNLEMAAGHIWNALRNMGLFLPDTYKEYFQMELSGWMKRNADSYDGYCSLDLISKRIEYNLIAVGIGNVDMKIFKEVVKDALPDIKESGRTIGFGFSGGER